MSNPGFPETDGASSYRPMSGWAIVAFVLGLGSSLALLGPILVIVPIAALGVAAWTIYQISHAELRPLGRRWAVAGLVLAALFGSAGVARFVARHRILHERATALCEDWITALQRGEPYLAFSMMRPSSARPVSEEIAKGMIDDENTRAAFRKFTSDAAVTTLLSERDAARVRFVRELAFVSTAERDQFSEVYEIEYRGTNGNIKRFLRLLLERVPPDGRFPRERWQIHDAVFVPAAAVG